MNQYLTNQSLYKKHTQKLYINSIINYKWSQLICKFLKIVVIYVHKNILFNAQISLLKTKLSSQFREWCLINFTKWYNEKYSQTASKTAKLLRCKFNDTQYLINTIIQRIYLY